MNERSFIEEFRMEQLTKGEQTRDDILNAAQTLFAEQGYHGTSMRQIADSAGIALGGIYNHFVSKEEIFKILIVEHHPLRELLPAIKNTKAETVQENVQHYAHTVLEKLNERHDYLHLVFIELIEFQARHLTSIIKSIFPLALQFANIMFSPKKDLRSKNIMLMFLLFMVIIFMFFLISTFIDKSIIGKMIKLDIYELLDLFLYGILNNKPEAAS